MKKGVKRLRKDGGYSICYADENKVGCGKCCHVGSYVTNAQNKLNNFFKKHGIDELDISNLIEFHSTSYIENITKQKGAIGGSDGKRIIIDEDSEFKEQIIIHEVLHHKSTKYVYDKNNELHQLSGISIDGKDTQLNEAFTDYLTEQIYNDKMSETAYDINRIAFSIFAVEYSKDELIDAYFNNKPKIIKDKLDKILTFGGYDSVSNCMETVVTSDDTQEVEECTKLLAFYVNQILRRHTDEQL